jgi:hypothetical protein
MKVNLTVELDDKFLGDEMKLNKEQTAALAVAVAYAFTGEAARAVPAQRARAPGCGHPSTEGTMKNTIICDIDGTLADLSHRLPFIGKNLPSGTVAGKKDWKAFHAAVADDAVHWDMRLILCALVVGAPEARHVFYVSGRMDSCRDATEDWLRESGFPRGDLYMRDEGDFRPDYVVKEEILDRDLKLTPDDVLCVLDDRDQVVQMWRRRGFRVLQVANGDF